MTIKILGRTIYLKDAWYFLRKKSFAILLGIIKKNLIYAYWGRSLNNFGDLLTPVLLKYYGLTPVHAYPGKAQFVSVGTLLGFMQPNFKGIIMGTGINQPDLKPFPDATVVGLRGKLTQNALGLQNKTITLGDPGLLVSRIFPESNKKRWKLGIVPHLSEIRHPIIEKWRKELGTNVKIINVLRQPKAVISEISACEYVISSSLHGLIIADSYKIPNIRFRIDDFYEYNYFRFEDYYSTLDVPYEYLQVNGNEKLDDLLVKFRQDFHMVDGIIDNLDKMFKDFANSYLVNNKSR